MYFSICISLEWVSRVSSIIRIPRYSVTDLGRKKVPDGKAYVFRIFYKIINL